MRNQLFATLLAICATAAPAAGQVDKRDHRGKDDAVDSRRGKRAIKPTPPHAVTGISPARGAAGTEVTITGERFRRGAQVRIGKQIVTPTRVSRTSITFAVPDSVQPGPRKVAVVQGRVEVDAGQFAVAPDRGPKGPVVRDHRDDKPGGGPVVRDHRDDKPGGGPEVRDHRKRPGPPGRRGPRFDHRRHPIVSGFFPRTGPGGTEVTIRGRRLPGDAVVVVDGNPVKAKRTGAAAIVFEMPRKATGTIALRYGNRDVPVGQFEVVAKRPSPADYKRQAKAREQRARERWDKRRAELAKTKDERRENLRKWREEQKRSRAERRRERRAQIRKEYRARFLSQPEVQAELALHGERMARLARIRRLAEVDARDKLVIRADVAMERETERHQRRMTVLRAAYDGK